jgi:predicted SAM-dependent methyltransferase
MMKLHLGSGMRLLENGWLNIDSWEGYGSDHPAKYLRHDLRYPIPFDDKSADYIYSEHFIEHLSREEGLAIFKEIFRLLKPHGIIRVSTPNLAELVDAYNKKELSRWVSWQPESPCRILNDGLTSWGHKFTYDEDELRNSLTLSGFKDIVSQPYGESPHPELRGLEHRPRQNDLILEARKFL